MSRKFLGAEKAAILLMNLGEEKAAQVLANMDEREIQTIGNYMSSLGNIDLKIMDSVNKDFYNILESGVSGLAKAGTDFLKSALHKALAPAKATEILDNITSPDEEIGGGLETIRLLEPEVIANFIENEHPQTAAIILAHLEPDVASQTVKKISENKRMEIVHRLATLERVSPQVLRELDDALQMEFQYSGTISGNKLGGKKVAARLMGAMDRATEAMILSSMEEIDPDMANEIRELRFTFEDLKRVEDEGIRLVLRDVSSEDLLVALKTASDELKIKILSNMSDRAASMLQEDLELLGPTKISAVEKAQQKIVSICKHLEDSGEIVMGRGEALV
ncbi:MAG: flagellar motor switch protein FliG [Nitrospinales bacterium]|jgi:flagellar motor switch protein FliG